MNELGVDTADDDNNNADEGTDSESNVVIITDTVTARLRLAQCILAGRIGLNPSYKGLSGICEKLFNTDSNTGLYIVASFLHQDGDEARAIEICNRIIENTDSADNFESRVLLLKADALIALAESIDDGDDKDAYYTEAENLLVNIRGLAKNNYISSSQRLIEVYEATDRYDEAHKIEEELMEFQ